MKSIVILPNAKKDINYEVTQRAAGELLSLGAAVYLSADAECEIAGAIRYTDFPKEAEAILVVGGDGSVLDAAPLAVQYGIALFGINCGRLGYLAEVEPADIESLSQIVGGEYEIEEKMLLEVSVGEGESVTVCERFAVNDCILFSNQAGIGEFCLRTGEGERVKYRGDGIVISTPVGSTAYSLSAGGPIVTHGIDAMLVTPVCPHSFFNRSIVFGAGETLRFEGKHGLKIQVDGRYFTSVTDAGVCTVRVAKERLKMLTLTRNQMISTLFRKMKSLENI